MFLAIFASLIEIITRIHEQIAIADLSLLYFSVFIKIFLKALKFTICKVFLCFYYPVFKIGSPLTCLPSCFEITYLCIIFIRIFIIIQSLYCEPENSFG